MRFPYTLFKVKSKNGIMWHARFWDETLQRYAHSKSTGIQAIGKKENRREAEEAAKKLFDEFTAERTNQEKFFIQTPITEQPQIILSSPSNPTKQEQQFTPTVQKNKSVASTPLFEYLKYFWSENSEYAIYKSDVKGKPLTPSYIKMNHNDIRVHVEPFPLFADVTVGTLTKAMLKKWLIWLAGRRKTRTKKDGTIIDEGVISGRRANSVLQLVRVAIRWAVDNEEIPADPFYKIGEVAEKLKEKGVLTFEERAKLIEQPITKNNYRSRLVMLLGSFCGLRRGEMRGLQWGDISNGIITVQHNYINGEGVKLPKYNSVRKVPITSDVQKLLDIVKEYGKNITPSTFVLESPKTKGEPVSNNFFRDRFEVELMNIGISAEQQDERFLSCHSLRHTFITLAEMSGVPDVVIRALVGHKSIQVQRNYSHAPQVINFDEARKKLETPYDTSLLKAVNS